MVKIDPTEVKTINVPRAHWYAAAAVIDAAESSKRALEDNPQFFTNPAHTVRVQKVIEILGSFFTEKREIFVNHRSNRGKPFTVVKIVNKNFPTGSKADIDTRYRTPLADMGIEVVFSKQTNSYLYRVY